MASSRIWTLASIETAHELDARFALRQREALTPNRIARLSAAMRTAQIRMRHTKTEGERANALAQHQALKIQHDRLKGEAV